MNNPVAPTWPGQYLLLSHADAQLNPGTYEVDEIKLGRNGLWWVALVGQAGWMPYSDFEPRVGPQQPGPAAVFGDRF